MNHYVRYGKPVLVFYLWCNGIGDLYCAMDKDYPIGKMRRAFWKVRGTILTILFGWWWWGRKKL